jgi:hypothetical protein
MPNIVAGLLFTLALATSAAAVETSGLRLSFTSLGPARIGMSRLALERALGTRLKSEDPDADSEGCEYVIPAHGYNGIGFMFINQHLARIDVSEATVATLAGAHVGSTQRSVLALYPDRITISPHAYSGTEGSYLTMLSPNRRYGIRFETDHGKVTVFYAGTAEAIRYIEGCL